MPHASKCRKFATCVCSRANTTCTLAGAAFGNGLILCLLFDIRSRMPNLGAMLSSMTFQRGLYRSGNLIAGI